MPVKVLPDNAGDGMATCFRHQRCASGQMSKRDGSVGCGTSCHDVLAVRHYFGIRKWKVSYTVQDIDSRKPHEDSARYRRFWLVIPLHAVILGHSMELLHPGTSIHEQTNTSSWLQIDGFQDW
jgi:hypothetical protein